MAALTRPQEDHLRRNALHRSVRDPDLLRGLSLQPLDRDQRRPVARSRPAFRSRGAARLQGLRQEGRRRSARFSLEGTARRSDGLSLVPWSSPFHEPIPPPKGRPLRTLKDAADYILKLPTKTAAAPHWQLAMEAVDRRCRGPELHHACPDWDVAGSELREAIASSGAPEKAREEL
jgi:hypothetical protein